MEMAEETRKSIDKKPLELSGKTGEENRKIVYVLNPLAPRGALGKSWMCGWKNLLTQWELRRKT